MSRFWSIVGYFLVVGGLAQTPLLSSKMDACTDEDYTIFVAALDELYGKHKAESVLLLDYTSMGYPPGLAAVTSASESQGFFKDIPKDTKDDFDARNRNRTKIEVGKIRARFETLSIGDEEAERLVHRKGGWEAFHQSYPRARGFTVISRPGFNREHNRALVYIGTSCGSTCGGGSLLFLSKETGEWKIVSTATTWLT